MKKKKNKIENDKSLIYQRTLSIIPTIDRDQYNIFNFLSNESKKIFNHYMFCLNVYNLFKNQFYDDIYVMHLNNQINNDNINAIIHIKMNSYYDLFSLNFNQYKINNNAIYNIIKNMNLIVTHLNYNDLMHIIIGKCISNKSIKFNHTNHDFLFYGIIENILTTFYMNNFFSVKNSLIHKEPIKEELKIDSFINHVKDNKLFYNNSTLLTPNQYILLSKKYTNLNSEQTLIRKLATHSLLDCKMYRDTMINIMDKAYESYKSYRELKFMGKKANKPKFKSVNEKYIIPLFASSFKKIDGQIRICLGNFVDKNYNEICKKKYSKIKQLKTYTLYEGKNKETFKGNFTYIDIPEKIKDTNIKLIIIKPLYNGHKFKINFNYEIEITKQNLLKDTDNNISIDLGMGNLMTIYDPNGEQYLIKGKKLIQSNEAYNRKIVYTQSELNKNGQHTSKRLRDLFIKRDNIINHYFNLITKKMYEMYKTKNKIIIGYNKLWKNGLNLGHNTNRKFYQIPYSKLLKKMRDKFNKDQIIETEESYTSKVDGLALEKICKHDKYMGKRIERGLFSSSTRVLINADVNGAINIMRKYKQKTGEDMLNIKGRGICNPRQIIAY